MSAVLRIPLRSFTVLRSNSKLMCNPSVLKINKTNLHSEKRISPFSLKGLFKYYELLPLVGILAAGTVALGCYLTYFCRTRNDTQFCKPAAYDPMDVRKPPVLKMVRSKDYKEYQPLHELDALYKEMAQAEEEQKKANK